VQVVLMAADLVAARVAAKVAVAVHYDTVII
jgi:hypothetical protein